MPSKMAEAGERIGTCFAEWVAKNRRNAINSLIVVHGLFAGMAWLFAWLLTSPDTWDADHTPMLHYIWSTVFWWTLGIELTWFYAPFINTFVKALWKVWRESE